MKTKKLVLGVMLSLLALVAPGAVRADSVDFTNSGGTLAGSDEGLSLSGSTLIAVNGLNGMGLITGNLGSVSFVTGALESGNLQLGGTFAAGGSSFVITGDGADGVPNGVIFSGEFGGPLSWTMITLPDGTHDYTLTDSVTGTWYTGSTVDGATTQLTINAGAGYFDGAVTLSSGDSNIVALTSVPEPGTLGLLGASLVGLAGAVRRKLIA